MTVPLLRAIEARLEPTDRLILIVRSPYAIDLLKCISWGKNVTIWHPTGGRLRRKWWLLKVLMQLRKVRPDVVLAPLFADRFLNAVWLRLTGAELSVVAPGKWRGRLGRCVTVAGAPGMHKTEEYLEYGRTAGLIDGAKPSVAITPPEALLKKTPSVTAWWRPDRRWVVLAPGSGVVEAHKRYPVESFRALARLLLQASPDIGVVALGSSKEQELIHSVLEVDGDASRRIALTGLSIAESLAVLSRCHCLVAACSGASHLGTAAGIPIVGIYGPTNPGHTGAYSNQLRVVRLGLKCSPCYRMKQLTGCGNPICMTLIPPETVFEAVLASLAGQPCPPVPWCETTSAREAIYPQPSIRAKSA
ncbi:MAG TPA: glycosyltransferase family 9 protein [Thermoguttaceae bacterium]|nr:glycosyltransferase family 9 protein [Thermoguttaceae bacterium]